MIISMSYMILDVLVFLFIFIIVYISFTLSMVHVYNVYGMDRTKHFNTHKMAFKLFFWAMIRTGNPQFAGKVTRTYSTVSNCPACTPIFLTKKSSYMLLLDTYK